MLSEEKGLRDLDFVRDMTTKSIEAALCKIPGKPEMEVEMIRTDVKRSFLPAKIWREGKEIWNFKKENFKGIAKLFKEIHDGFCIVLISKQKLERALPVSALPTEKITLPGGGESYSNVDILENSKLKLRISKALHLEANLFPDEQNLLEKSKDLEVRQKEQKKQQKIAAREQKIAEIIKRQKAQAITEAKEKVWGLPASEEEWQCLKPGTKIILVDNPQAKEMKPLEAFIVGKEKGGRVYKKNIKKIKDFWYSNNFSPKIEIRPEKTCLLIDKGRMQTVLLFNQNKEDLEKTAPFLNNGSLVATIAANNGGNEKNHHVFQVKNKKLESYGSFQLQ